MPPSRTTFAVAIVAGVAIGAGAAVLSTRMERPTPATEGRPIRPAPAPVRSDVLREVGTPKGGYGEAAYGQYEYVLVTGTAVTIDLRKVEAGDWHLPEGTRASLFGPGGAAIVERAVVYSRGEGYVTLLVSEEEAARVRDADSAGLVRRIKSLGPLRRWGPGDFPMRKPSIE